jgi:hypothetical protein
MTNQQKDKIIKWGIMTIAFALFGYGIYHVIVRGKQNLPFGQDDSNSGTSNCNQDFPLKKGSCGDRLILVNTYLFNQPTNKFTKETQTELFDRFGVKEISEELFNRIKGNWTFSDLDI